MISCCLFISPAMTLADSEAGGHPYAVETADKKFVFVMVDSCDREGQYYRGLPPYTKSGIYPNDGSTTPLWTVDWCGRVFLPPGCDHVVREGAWSRSDLGGDQEGVTFFARGQLLKHYRVGDLVTFIFLLPHTSSHFQWRRSLADPDGSAELPRGLEDTWPRIAGNGLIFNDGVVFDESAKTMTIETMQGDHYVFDYATGETISSRRPFRIAAASLALLVSLLYGLYLLRVTAKPFRPPWRKLRSFLAVTFIVAVALTTTGSLLNSHFLAHDPRDLDFVSQSLWRLFVVLPYEVLNPAGWVEWSDFAWFIERVAFWLIVSLTIGLANNLVVGAISLTRLRKKALSTSNI